MSALISTTKQQIKRIAPFAKDVNIKIERDHDQILSKIHVHIAGAILHVEKKGETVSEALELSYQAIARQIDRVKSKKLKRTPKFWKWQMPTLDNF